MDKFEIKENEYLNKLMELKRQGKTEEYQKELEIFKQVTLDLLKITQEIRQAQNNY